MSAENMDVFSLRDTIVDEYRARRNWRCDCIPRAPR